MGEYKWERQWVIVWESERVSSEAVSEWGIEMFLNHKYVLTIHYLTEHCYLKLYSHCFSYNDWDKYPVQAKQHSIICMWLLGASQCINMPSLLCAIIKNIVILLCTLHVRQYNAQQTCSLIIIIMWARKAVSEWVRYRDVFESQIRTYHSLFDRALLSQAL